LRLELHDDPPAGAVEGHACWQCHWPPKHVQASSLYEHGLFSVGTQALPSAGEVGGHEHFNSRPKSADWKGALQVQDCPSAG
jgi:hypothetical protein